MDDDQAGKLDARAAGTAWLEQGLALPALPGDGERVAMHWQADLALLARAKASPAAKAAGDFFDQPAGRFERLLRA
ncbi:MAG TPA: hypothetical protein VN222_06075 [Novosphingobium sp.]|nr:hypothetical protein [Novosphingobium sp.]